MDCEVCTSLRNHSPPWCYIDTLCDDRYRRSMWCVCGSLGFYNRIQLDTAVCVMRAACEATKPPGVLDHCSSLSDDWRCPQSPAELPSWQVCFWQFPSSFAHPWDRSLSSCVPSPMGLWWQWPSWLWVTVLTVHPEIHFREGYPHLGCNIAWLFSFCVF